MMRNAMGALLLGLALAGCVGVGIQTDTQMLGDSDVAKVLQKHWHESENRITSLVREEIAKRKLSGRSSADVVDSLTSFGLLCAQDRAGDETEVRCRYEGSVVSQTTRIYGTTAISQPIGERQRIRIEIQVTWRAETAVLPIVTTKKRLVTNAE